MSAQVKDIEMPDEEIYDIASMGEGLSLISRRTTELTMEFAGQFLEYADFATADEKIDRRVQEEHVIFLARQMEAGTFRWEQVNLMLCEYAGRHYRMNGQHTCWARLHAENMPEGTRTPVQVLKYKAETFQDMRQLYATIDRGKARNRSNVVISYLAGSEEFPGYPKSTLRRLAMGLSFWVWETSERRSLHTGDETSYLMLRDHHKVSLAVGTLINESKPSDFKHLNRQPVLAAMYATFNKAPQIAREFWLMVRDGVGVSSKEDPRYVLRNYLMSCGLTATRLTGGDARTVDTEEMYRACILAWNAHRSGRLLKHIRVPRTEERPEAR